jgi:hypothetical protein
MLTVHRKRGDMHQWKDASCIFIRHRLINEARSAVDNDLALQSQPSTADVSSFAGPPATATPPLLVQGSLYDRRNEQSYAVALSPANFDQVLLDDATFTGTSQDAFYSSTSNVFLLNADLNNGPSLQAGPLALTSTASTVAIRDSLDVASSQAMVSAPRVLTAKVPSDGCRRFIASIFRTYPQMMAASSTLPPFIHPLSCGFTLEANGNRLEWNKAMVDTLSESSSAAEILANCMSISQMFVARTPMSEKMLWRTLQAEQRRLLDEVSDMWML